MFAKRSFFYYSFFHDIQNQMQCYNKLNPKIDLGQKDLFMRTALGQNVKVVEMNKQKLKKFRSWNWWVIKHLKLKENEIDLNETI